MPITSKFLHADFVESSRKLRAVLISVSLGIGVCVLAIFSYVSFYISYDIAYASEQREAERFDCIIREQIDQLLSSGKSVEEAKNWLQQHYASGSKLTPRLVIFEGKQRIIRLILADKQSLTENIEEVFTGFIVPSISEDSPVFFTQDDTSYFIYTGQTEQFPSVLYIHPAIALQEATTYIQRRLSIAAFIVFWLLVWFAITIATTLSQSITDKNEKLIYLARYDQITHMLNKHAFMAKLQHLTEQESNNNQIAGYLVIIELNQLKEISDHFGHDKGDKILTALSARLEELLDGSELYGRYSDHSFVVWLPHKSKQNTQVFLQQLSLKFGLEIDIDNQAFELHSTIGAAHYPNDANNTTDLLKKADIARKQADKLRLSIQFYQQDADLDDSRKVKYSSQLKHALDNKEFILYYQPKVTIPDGITVGVEALARWQHPQDGLLSPFYFIELIEQRDMIHTFSRFALASAIKQASIWLEQDMAICIAVNLSPYNLLDNELVSFITEQLTLYKLPANLLEIELTESATMVNLSTTMRVFKQLRAIGVRLSIDDFGTGMSSLAYLQKIDADYIKIDRSFIRDICSKPEDEKMLRGLIGLCHDLNKEVVAEGIETIEQANKLADMGCVLVQGFYYGKPMPAEQISKLIKS